jgi:hypothetical protein
MSQLIALSVSIALLGGIAAALYVWLNLLLWAGFIAWGTFFSAGGDTAALRRTIAGNVFGVIVGIAAVMILSNLSGAGWLWVPKYVIVIGVTVLILGLASRLELLSHLPASIYGYAAAFVATSLTIPEAPGAERFTALHLYNPVINVLLSMVGGALFGLASSKLAAILKGS